MIMSRHLFAAVVTHHGIAANNRGETEGNVTTLQKLLWQGQVHTTVSAEAIRFALRHRLALSEPEGTNRQWDEDERSNRWEDDKFGGWKTKDGATFIDDDLLGYMSATAAKEEGEAGSADVRRAVLEVSRAISLLPWAGDVTFNAASPRATSSAAKKGNNPVPYGTEMHATRYQYGIALTPERLRKKDRVKAAITGLCELAEVAGNHGRFLFDFSPESIVFRLTDDPAPRLLYIFEQGDQGLDAPLLLARVEAGDIKAEELVIGGSFATAQTAGKLKEMGADVFPGIRKSAETIIAKLGS
jgi:CRISPR-associated protein Cst2